MSSLNKLSLIFSLVLGIAAIAVVYCGALCGLPVYKVNAADAEPITEILNEARHFDISGGVLTGLSTAGQTLVDAEDCIAVEIVVPDSVTAIEEKAFYNCEKLTEIELPAVLTTVGDKAFYGCSNLSSVNYQGTIDQWARIEFVAITSNPLHCGGSLLIKETEIGSVEITANKISNYAFYKCVNLTAVKLTDTVTTIGDSAFYGCTGLTTLTLPATLHTIGARAFSGCSGLANVDLSATGIDQVPDYCFDACTNLTKVELPDNLKAVGTNAFQNCSNLTSLELPYTLATFGSFAFSGCSGLTSVDYQGTLNEWAQINFDNQEANPLSVAQKLLIQGKTISAVEITVDVNAYAFYNCTNLTAVELTDAVTTVGAYAFQNCRNLYSVKLPDTLTMLGDSGFSKCSSLMSIDLSSTGITQVPDYCFNECGNLASVKLPADLKAVGTNAFQYCESLTTIDLSQTQITEIPDYCFFYCGSLTSIKLPATLTTLGVAVFNQCNNLGVMICPDAESLTAYKNGVLKTYATLLATPSRWQINLTNHNNEQSVFTAEMLVGGNFTAWHCVDGVWVEDDDYLATTLQGLLTLPSGWGWQDEAGNKLTVASVQAKIAAAQVAGDSLTIDAKAVKGATTPDEPENPDSNNRPTIETATDEDPADNAIRNLWLIAVAAVVAVILVWVTMVVEIRRRRR